MRTGHWQGWGLAALLLGAGCQGTQAPAAGAEAPPSSGSTGPRVESPAAGRWQVLGVESGAPLDVRGVTQDAGGNLWVAGGEEGLFLMRAGEGYFERFTEEDGLQLHGLLLEDGAHRRTRPLRVVSVAGAGAGTVFVGYAGPDDCEGPLHEAQGAAVRVRRADADRVTLTPGGLRAVHYELAARGHPGRPGPVCTVRRIAYDARARRVWFAADAGFSWVDADEADRPFRQVLASQVPLPAEAEQTCSLGATEPAVWASGARRTTGFRLLPERLVPSWRGGGEEEGRMQVNALDVYEGLEEAVTPPALERRVDDVVGARAQEGTGALLGPLAPLDCDGTLLGLLLSAPPGAQPSALARDSRDGSLWLGHASGGLTRLHAGGVVRYPDVLAGPPVRDIQVVGEGEGRRVLVGFGGGPGRPGGVGIYSGE